MPSHIWSNYWRVIIMALLMCSTTTLCSKDLGTHNTPFISTFKVDHYLSWFRIDNSYDQPSWFSPSAFSSMLLSSHHVQQQQSSSSPKVLDTSICSIYNKYTNSSGTHCQQCLSVEGCVWCESHGDCMLKESVNAECLVCETQDRAGCSHYGVGEVDYTEDECPPPVGSTQYIINVIIASVVVLGIIGAIIAACATKRQCCFAEGNCCNNGGSYIASPNGQAYQMVPIPSSVPSGGTPVPTMYIQQQPGYPQQHGYALPQLVQAYPPVVPNQQYGYPAQPTPVIQAQTVMQQGVPIYYTLPNNSISQQTPPVQYQQPQSGNVVKGTVLNL